ncbi:MAG: DUF262 domain-containing protein [Duganella sp.]
MNTEIVMDDAEDDAETPLSDPKQDPEEFFAKNAFRIIYQTNNFFLPQLRDLIDKGEVLNLRPEYQRRLRWSSSQKSRLVESLLLNIPVPPVFLYENDAARYEVMDGQQRLNAVREFIAGEFALTGLSVLSPLNGLRYSRCPPRIKRSLDRASLSAIVLLLESETEKTHGSLTITDIRRFIFDRLNTGGTKLNSQEIRNSVHAGYFKRVILQLTRFELFTKVFDIPPYTESDPNDYYENPERQKNILYSTMGDCQLVLRYFALREEENIRGSMKLMLDRAMAKSVSDEDGAALQQEFIERFTFLYVLFDENPFVLPADDRKRKRISAAIYDASMVAINDLWDSRDAIKADRLLVQKRFNAALNDAGSFLVLTGYGNTAKAVKERIALMRNILKPG